MTLTVLKSGSKGNGYVIQNETEALILECGCPVKNCLSELKTSNVVGVFCSHAHGDHMGYVHQYCKYFNIYASNGTIEEYCEKKPRPNNLFAISENNAYSVGGFTIYPFSVQHDCNEPYGYLINHEETGFILFATDTFYLKHKFSNISNYMIECNYDLDILKNNVLNMSITLKHANRVMSSHMSIDTCLKIFESSDLSITSQIVLLHLSNDNSNPKAFRDTIEKATGKKTYIAEKGLTIPFNKKPF